MDKLLRLSEDEEKSEWVCREGVKYLKNHTLEHFEHEESYMRSIGYGDYDLHKRLHDNFRNEGRNIFSERHYNTYLSF